ncbi:hypothetical protein [Haloparvum sedimenti]|uniref:hypothetical protein n=1 Tax=Haloparvum sedimenti TaxID=1678448 RepID=UPI00159EE9D3|nr:hypothetical protein [Haloparvum sedimenti]
MVCTVCNGGGGERVTVSFVDSDTEVAVTLCPTCRESFASADVCRVLSAADAPSTP